MTADETLKLVLATLDDMKALDVKVIDVRGRTDITDIMVIASGSSSRHVKAVADAVALAAKQAGNPAFGMEGEEVGEWVLVDLYDVVVHVMQPSIRDFYSIERLWEAEADS